MLPLMPLQVVLAELHLLLIRSITPFLETKLAFSLFFSSSSSFKHSFFSLSHFEDSHFLSMEYLWMEVQTISCKERFLFLPTLCFTCERKHFLRETL